MDLDAYFVTVCSGAAVGSGPGSGHRAQCEHHEGKIYSAKLTDKVTLWIL